MSDMLTIEIEGAVSSGKSPVAYAMKSYLESTGKSVCLCDHLLFKGRKGFDKEYGIMWDIANESENDVYIAVIGTGHEGTRFNISFDNDNIMGLFFPPFTAPFFNSNSDKA